MSLEELCPCDPCDEEFSFATAPNVIKENDGAQFMRAPTAERRSMPRYKVPAGISYIRLEPRDEAGMRQGRIVNVSAAGVLFESSETFVLGAKLEFLCPWPFSGRANSPIVLRIIGRAVRVEANLTALAIEKHEFRLLALANNVTGV